MLPIMKPTRPFILILLLILIISVVFSSAYFVKTNQASSNLSTILTHHNFPKESDQFQIIELLRLAGCFDPIQMKEDLKIAGFDDGSIDTLIAKIVPLAKDNFNKVHTQIVLNLFDGLGTTTQDLEKLHNWFIKVTQREFFAHKAGEERWQQATGKWMVDNDKAIEEIITGLGLRNEKAPALTHYDAIAVFGSTAPEMEKRLRYAKRLIEERSVSADAIYLLVGERPADKAVEAEYMAAITRADSEKTADKITETDLMRFVYEKTKGEGKFAAIPRVVVDTPKGSKQRPNTIDTLVLFSKTLPATSDVMNVLFISRAPNIQAQAEDTFDTLSTSRPDIKPEIAGDACEKAVTLNRVIGALGGSWFGGYVRVERELGSRASKEDLLRVRETLKYNPAPAADVAPAPAPAPAQAALQRTKVAITYQCVRRLLLSMAFLLSNNNTLPTMKATTPKNTHSLG